MRAPQSAIVTLVLLAATACHGTEPTSICDNTESHVLTVSGGVRPQFSWTPRCVGLGLAVFALLKTADGADSIPVVWATDASFPPPVTYGDTALSSSVAASPLVKGQRYVVQLYGSNACHGADCFNAPPEATVAGASFTP